MSTSKRVKPNEVSFDIREDYLSDEFKKQFKTTWRYDYHLPPQQTCMCLSRSYITCCYSNESQEIPGVWSAVASVRASRVAMT